MATVSIPPARTVKQRRRALTRANEVRVLGKEFKQTMASLSRDDAVEFARCTLLDPSSMVHMPLHEFLVAIPKIGPVKVRRLLTRHQIWPLKCVGELTVRQRGLLAEALVVLASRR